MFSAVSALAVASDDAAAIASASAEFALVVASALAVEIASASAVSTYDCVAYPAKLVVSADKSTVLPFTYC